MKILSRARRTVVWGRSGKSAWDETTSLDIKRQRAEDLSGLAVWATACSFLAKLSQ
jgi:hypothetical protein